MFRLTSGYTLNVSLHIAQVNAKIDYAELDIVSIYESTRNRVNNSFHNFAATTSVRRGATYAYDADQGFLVIDAIAGNHIKTIGNLDAVYRMNN